MIAGVGQSDHRQRRSLWDHGCCFVDSLDQFALIARIRDAIPFEFESGEANDTEYQSEYRLQFGNL